MSKTLSIFTALLLSSGRREYYVKLTAPLSLSLRFDTSNCLMWWGDLLDYLLLLSEPIPVPQLLLSTYLSMAHQVFPPSRSNNSGSYMVTDSQSLNIGLCFLVIILWLMVLATFFLDKTLFVRFSHVLLFPSDCVWLIWFDCRKRGGHWGCNHSMGELGWSEAMNIFLGQLLSTIYSALLLLPPQTFHRI